MGNVSSCYSNEVKQSHNRCKIILQLAVQFKNNRHFVLGFCFYFSGLPFRLYFCERIFLLKLFFLTVWNSLNFLKDARKMTKFDRRISLDPFISELCDISDCSHFIVLQWCTHFGDKMHNRVICKKIGSSTHMFYCWYYPILSLLATVAYSKIIYVFTANLNLKVHSSILPSIHLSSWDVSMYMYHKYTVCFIWPL